MDWHVGIMLASSVELFAHSNRILATLSKVPGVGSEGGARIGQMLIPMIGPRIGALKEMFRATSSEEGMRMATRIQRTMGTSGRFLQQEFKGEVGPAASLKRAGKTDAAELVELGRDFLFGLPEFGTKGLYGFDERARIVAGVTANRLTKRHLGRDLTDAELRQVLEGFGKYNRILTSNIVDFLRKNKLNPFVGGQAGLIPRELSQFFGGSGLPRSVRDGLTKEATLRLKSEVLYRGVVGTAMAATMVQYAMTQRFPWDNDELGLSPSDIVMWFDEEGRPVYIPFTSYAPGLSRAFRITTLRAMVENFGEPREILNDAGLDLLNTAITYGGASSPAFNQATTALTGRTGFVTGGGELLEVVPPQANFPLTVKERILESAGTANPTVEELFGFNYQDEIAPLSVKISNAVMPGMKVGPKPKEALAREITQPRDRMKDVVRDRVDEAQEKFPRSIQQRVQFYRDEALDFSDPQERRDALQAMIQADITSLQSLRRNAERARRQP
jgi:hypothetical protein